MKTKELILLLKKADLNENYHISINRETIYSIDTEPGYYDGAYCYMDDDKFVISDKNTNVKIKTYNYEDFIWDNNGNYDKIKLNVNDKKIYKERFEKISKEYKSFEQKSLEEFIFKVFLKLKEGYTIIEEIKEYKIGKIGIMFYIKGKQKKQLNCGSQEVVKNSGFFKSEKKKNNVIEWILNI